METFWGPDLERWFGDSPRLVEFGAVVAQEIDPLVYALERDGPTTDGANVQFHPAYAQAGRAVWASGILAAEPLEQAGLFFLLTHAGEGGHACPVTCTAGLIRALRLHGSDELRERFLPPLLETDYDACQRGSQFLTEEHGGSDVGANLTRAVRDGDAWRLHGEKWFCSVADADQFAVTARPEGAPEGTRGIGCFLVPRTVDGRPNGFTIRKLKDKLGTRALATGEIVFDGARRLSDRRARGRLQDRGRRRAQHLALAERGRLGGGDAPRVSRGGGLRAGARGVRPADRRVPARAREPRGDAGGGGGRARLDARGDAARRLGRSDDVAYHRILVNANKFSTSAAATRAIRRGIEVLGGNGTIEDFSVLPRLWRDAIVFESWEGTHNVLCAQVARDLERFGTLELVLARSRGVDPRIDAALDSLRERMAPAGPAALPPPARPARAGRPGGEPRSRRRADGRAPHPQAPRPGLRPGARPGVPRPDRGPSCRARALTTVPPSAIVMSVSAQSCWSTASTPSWPPTASP